MARSRAPIAASWDALDEPDRGKLADRFLYGKLGALGYLRKARRLVESRPDLAAKALRQGAKLYAAVGHMGYTVAGVDAEIDGLARDLRLVVDR